MPRTSSTDPADAAADPSEPAPAETPAEPSTDDIPLGQRQMNEVMAAEGTSRPDDTSQRNAYPPGSDVLNPDNARRYPELFTEEQVASQIVDEPDDEPAPEAS